MNFFFVCSTMKEGAPVLLEGDENLLRIRIDQLRPGFPQRMDNVVDEADL
jgi:hypothetical protein